MYYQLVHTMKLAVKKIINFKLIKFTFFNFELLFSFSSKSELKSSIGSHHFILFPSESIELDASDKDKFDMLLVWCKSLFVFSLF